MFSGSAHAYRTIDTWNYADPAKIIALIPEDIKPYVVFNISMSIYWIRDNKQWDMVQDGYELAKSWLKTCAYEHFANLLKLCNKYGGYLNINWCANRWSAPLNPVAMLKQQIGLHRQMSAKTSE